MTLATHAITGAALASFVPTHPALAFTLGFASHFLLDAIPHWDYPIFSDSIHPKKENQKMKIDRAFFRDAIDFSFDSLIGLGISMLAFASPASAIAIIAGALGGILPDPLQFVAKKIHHEPLISLQRFHQWIHTSYHLRESGHVALGISSQIVFVVCVVALAKYSI